MSADENEARVLGRHLLGADPGKARCALYARALELRPCARDRRDDAICSAIMRHPWLLGPLDAALALVRPSSALRHKLTIMTAVLETQAAYTDRFLPTTPSPLALAHISWIALRAALRAAMGLILLPLFS